MKQSHNALSYLRAQYSAVYGRAYVKGLATAMVVTSAFASSFAQAATNDNGNNTADRDPQAQPPRINNASSSLLSQDIKLSDLTTELGYTRSAQAADQASAIYRSQPRYAARAMPNAYAENTASSDFPTAPNITWGKNSTAGSNSINAYSILTGINWYQQLSVGASADIELVAQTENSQGSQSYKDFGMLVVGSSTDNGTQQLTTVSGSKLTLYDNTALQINGAGGDNTLDGNLIFNAQSSGSQAVINVGMNTAEADQSNSKLNLDGNVTVKSGSGSAAIYAPNVDLTGNVTLESGTSLTLDGAIKETMKSGSLADAHHSAGNFTGHGTTLTIGNGAKVLVGKGSYANGSGNRTVLDLSDDSSGGNHISGSGTLEVQGSAILSSTVLEDFVKAATDNGTDNGNVTLASGGRLEFSDNSTELTDYKFGTVRGDNSKHINVLDATVNGEEANVIAGNTLSLKSSIYTKPNGRDEDLNLDLEATNLELGGDTSFDSSTNTLGYQKAVTQNVNFNDVKGTFHLKDNVTLDGGAHNPKLSNQGSGTSTGNVIIDNSGDYLVQQGTYTHSGNMTLNGGDLKIVADHGQDASLSVSGNFEFTNSGGCVTVLGETVKGNTHKATLDLTQAKIDTNNSNDTHVVIGDSSGAHTGIDSSLKLKGEQLNTLVNNNSIFLYASGEIDASSSGTASLNTDQLQGTINLPSSGQTQNKITFYSGGVLRTDVLNLSGDRINIGLGTIDTNTLAFENSNNADAQLGEGTYQVADALTTTNGKLVLDSGAKVTLDHDASTSSNNTNISSDLVLNSGSTLNVHKGDWMIGGSGDLSASNANITIGSDITSIPTAADASLNGNNLVLTNSTFNLKSNGAAHFNGIELTSGSTDKSLNIEGALDIDNNVKLASGNRIIINGDLGSVHFGEQATKNIHLTDSNNDGKLDVNSGTFANVFNLEDGGHLKLDFDDKTNFNRDQIKQLRKTLLSDAKDDGSAMDPSKHGFIHLGEATIDGYGGDADENGMTRIPFKDYQPNTGSENSSKNTQVFFALDADKQGKEVGEFDDIIADIRSDQLDDVLLYNIDNDQNHIVKGKNIGALFIKNGEQAKIKGATLAHAVPTSDGKRQFISKQIDAADGDVLKMEGGELLGAEVLTGGYLYLENGGYIGKIILDDGSNSDLTTLTVNKRNENKLYASGSGGITYISSIEGGTNTKFINNDVSHVTSGDVTIGYIENHSDLSVDDGDLNIKGDSLFVAGSKTEISGQLSVTDERNTSHFNLESGANIKANSASVRSNQLELGGKIELSDSGTSSFTGDKITLTASSDITATNGNLSFTIDDTSGKLEQAAGGKLNAIDISFSGNTYLAGSSTAKDKFTVSNNGADSSFTLDSGGNITANSADVSATNVALSGNINLTNDGTFAGNVINLASGSNITSSNGDLSFTSSGNSGNTINQDKGSVLNANNINFTGDTTLAGSTTATNKLTVDTTKGAQNKFTLDAGADVKANSADLRSSAFDLNGSITLGDDGDFTGDTIHLGSSSKITSSSGDLNFTIANSANKLEQEAGSQLSANNINFTGDVTLAGSTTATNKLTVDTTKGAQNSFTLASGANVKANSADLKSGEIDIGGTINLGGNGNFTGNTTRLASGASISSSSGDLSFTASGSSGNFVQDSNSSLKGNNLTVNAGNDVTLVGKNTFTGAGTVTAGNKLNIGGTQSFTKQAAFTGNTIDIAANASVNSSGDLSFTASGSSGNFVQNSGSNLKGNNLTITAGNDVTLAGDNTFTGTGTITAGNKLNIGGTQSFASGAIFNGHNISIGSGTGVTSSNDNLTFNALDNANTTNGNFVQDANSSLGGKNLNVTASHDITLAGNNSFNGSGSISAANALNVNGTQSFLEGAELVGNTINLAAQSSITSSGDLSFNAPSSSSGTGNGNLVQNANSGLRGKNLNITAGNDVTLAGNNAFTGSGSVSAAHEINLGGDQSFANGASFTSNIINLASGSNVTNTSGNLSFTGLVMQDSGSVISAPVVTFDNTSTTQNPSGSTSILAGNNSFNTATLRGNYNLHGTNQIEDLTIANGTSTFLGTNNTVRTLRAQDGTGVLQIGTDATNASKTEASMQIDQLQLSGSKLYVDPDYGAPTALVAVTNKSVSGSNIVTPNLEHTLDGNLILGKNAAGAWGEDLTDLRKDISAYQSGGSLRYSTASSNDSTSNNTFGTVLVLNDPMQVDDGNHIVLNSNTNNSTLADAEKLATLSDGRTADLALSDQSLLVVKLGAVGPTEETNTPAIKFNKNHAVVYSEGGQIVLDGIYDVRKEIDVFADADNDATSGNSLSGVELVGNDIRISSKNGLFNSTLLAQAGANRDNVGHVKLTATTREVEDYFYQASDPVKNTLIKYKDSNPSGDGTSNYLNAVLTNGDRGHAAETAARMAVYGGAINAALSAGEVAQEEVARRTGIGFGAPGGTSFKPTRDLEVWANTTYNRKDSDGYSAQGVAYGNDMDLTVLTAGAELKLSKDIAVGGLIDIAKGDVDGKGAGSGIQNNFDAYGIGFYGATKIDNFSLVGDISYHKVDNDLSSKNSVDRLSASVDSSNLSLGVTGRMDLKLNGVKVSPHAGLRYQKIKLDDYGINGNQYGRIVDYSADSLDVFSIPVGVTLSNDYITSEGWQLKPAIDFTATLNLGDRKSKGTASWTGSSFVTPLSTEVLDPVVYGINVGFSARKDNFSVGSSLKYTGSSNTSDFGLQVDVRYDF